MKKLGILAMILVLVTSVAMAQRGGQNVDPKERAKSQTEQLKKALDLDKDQEKKVYELNLKAGKEMAEMRKDMQGGGGDRDAMRKKFGAMREKQNKEMKKVLSDDQYKKYLKNQEEQMKKRRQQGGRR
jgi:hypothetical protein